MRRRIQGTPLETQIIRRYESGESSGGIARDTGISAPQVCRIIKRNGIARRGASEAQWSVSEESRRQMAEAHRDGATQAQLAHEFGVSCSVVRRVMKSTDACVCTPSNRVVRRTHGIVRRHAFSHPDYFAVVDTPEKAYWLGMWYADGNVMTYPKYVFQAALQLRDQSQIDQFLEDIGTSQKAKTRPDINRVYVSIANKQLVTDLVCQGMWPRKSLTLAPPPLKDTDLVRHFLRGFFDGNGTVGIYDVGPRGKRRNFQPRLGFYSTAAVCEWIGDVIERELGFAPPSVIEAVGCFKITYNGRGRCSAIAEWLYRDATRWLPRKREICARFVALPSPGETA